MLRMAGCNNSQCLRLCVLSSPHVCKVQAEISQDTGDLSTAGSVSPYLTVPSTNPRLKAWRGGGMESLPADLTRREYYTMVYLLVPVIVFAVRTTPLTLLMAPSLAQLVV